MNYNLGMDNKRLMDAEFKELLMNRLKFLEYEGYNSPTMKVINKNSLNPKIFKLKKIFTKGSLVNKHKDLKINLADLCKKQPFKLQESHPLPENLKKLYSDSKSHRFAKLPSLSKLEYQNLAAFRRKISQRYQHEPAKSISVEPFSYKLKSKKIKLLPYSPKTLNLNIQKLSLNESGEVSKSLDVSHSKRVILSKTKELVSKDCTADVLEA